MNFLIVLVATVACVLSLRSLILKAPFVLYIMAISLDVLFILSLNVAFPRPVFRLLGLLMHKCTLSLALFSMVMFLGVFRRESAVRQWLQPIRSELSIAAWILSLGHMTVFFESYLVRFFAGAANLSVLVALVVAIILFFLLIVLGATSFQFVKKKISHRAWKSIQKLSYVFYGLVFLHLMLMLMPPALRGGEAAQVSVAIYSVLFIGYMVARVGRLLIDRRKPRSVEILSDVHG